MFNESKTKAEAQVRRYNRWAGNPKGNAYNPTRCAYEVCGAGRGAMFYQCLRQPGHGPDGLYCKQHAKLVEQSS